MQSGISKHFKKALLATAIISGLSTQVNADLIQGNDLNSSEGSNETISSLYSANRGTNGGGDQSLQFGDVLYGTSNDDVIIGGLGIDVLWGKDGDDILVGGKDRDRAFGGEGEDIFIWAPGDASDYFDGGNDIDVLVLGLFEEGAVDIVNSPGFCEIVERDENNSADLAALKLDHLVRFISRGKRAAFLASLDTDTPLEDDGLRIAMHINNVEYLVCGGTEEGTAKVFDLTVIPAVEVDISQLPLKAQTLVGDSFSAPTAL